MKYDLRSTKRYDKWLAGIKDKLTYARILNRINNAAEGSFGDHKQLGPGLFELRLFFGSGYRIYYTIQNRKIIFLIAGGDKSTQEKDISKAKKLLKQLED